MKTKEFIKKVEELGYDIEISEVDVFIKYDGYIIARISSTSPYTMSVYAAFGGRHAKELFDLCAEYARTPIEEREEEKKYYLKLKRENREFYESLSAYLTLRKRDNTFSLDVGVETAGLTAQFTQKEIDEIKEKFNTELSEFEQIPVEKIKAE